MTAHVSTAPARTGWSIRDSSSTLSQGVDAAGDESSWPSLLYLASRAHGSDATGAPAAQIQACVTLHVSGNIPTSSSCFLPCNQSSRLNERWHVGERSHVM